MSDVSEIVTKYLEDNGFGGLISEHGCHCRVGEIMYAEGEIEDVYCNECRPAYQCKKRLEVCDVMMDNPGLDLNDDILCTENPKRCEYANVENSEATK
jgi:hypothetical protein